MTVLNPLAVELNDALRAASPTTYELLSARGRALYFPKGILSQSAEAREKAHRMNATIGVATQGAGPMALPSVLEHVSGIGAARNPLSPPRKTCSRYCAACDEAH